MSKLFVSVYRSDRKNEMYLYTNKQAALNSLPEELLTIFGKPRHVMDMLLTPERMLARANSAQVLRDIGEKGFYLQMPPAQDDYIQDLPDELLSFNDPQ